MFFMLLYAGKSIQLRCLAQKVMMVIMSNDEVIERNNERNNEKQKARHHQLHTYSKFTSKPKQPGPNNDRT
jgi:hypothetical protein